MRSKRTLGAPRADPDLRRPRRAAERAVRGAAACFQSAPLRLSGRFCRPSSFALVPRRDVPARAGGRADAVCSRPRSARARAPAVCLPRLARGTKQTNGNVPPCVQRMERFVRRGASPARSGAPPPCLCLRALRAGNVATASLSGGVGLSRTGGPETLRVVLFLCGFAQRQAGARCGPDGADSARGRFARRCRVSTPTGPRVPGGRRGARPRTAPRRGPMPSAFFFRRPAVARRANVGFLRGRASVERAASSRDWARRPASHPRGWGEGRGPPPPSHVCRAVQSGGAGCDLHGGTGVASTPARGARGSGGSRDRSPVRGPVWRLARHRFRASGASARSTRSRRELTWARANSSANGTLGRDRRFRLTALVAPRSLFAAGPVRSGGESKGTYKPPRSPSWQRPAIRRRAARR